MGLKVLYFCLQKRQYGDGTHRWRQTVHLSTLRLHGMERNWKALNDTRRSNEFTLSEGLILLLQAEADERDEKRF